MMALGRGRNAAREAWSTRLFFSRLLRRWSLFLRSGMQVATERFSGGPLTRRPIPWDPVLWRVRRTFSSTESLIPAGKRLHRGQCGQGTVEAAVLLPTLFFLLGFLMQPACVLYTRSVMRATAGECARVLATARTADDEADCRSFALRRLEAVPEVSVFHVGGSDDWNISFDRLDGEVTVRIAGHLRPLPLIGMTASALGAQDEVGTLLDVSVTEQVRPGWLGGNYGSWVKIWG